MKVAVLSDTHMPTNSHSLPPGLVDRLKGVNLIVHAGDFTEEFVIDELERLFPGGYHRSVIKIAGLRVM